MLRLQSHIGFVYLFFKTCFSQERTNGRGGGMAKDQSQSRWSEIIAEESSEMFGEEQDTLAQVEKSFLSSINTPCTDVTFPAWLVALEEEQQSWASSQQGRELREYSGKMCSAVLGFAGFVLVGLSSPSTQQGGKFGKNQYTTFKLLPCLLHQNLATHPK